MKLSRTVVYALRATLKIAETGGTAPVPCSRLAQEGKMPERFLLQILRTLVTADILVSTRGVEGGYRLANPPDKVSLLNLIEAIEGPITKSTELSEELSAKARDGVKRALKATDEALTETLGSLTLADLMEPQ